jgi:triosephosphate isomerase
VNGQTVGGIWSASSIDGVLVGKASTTVESLNELKAGIL